MSSYFLWNAEDPNPSVKPRCGNSYVFPKRDLDPSVKPRCGNSYLFSKRTCIQLRQGLFYSNCLDSENSSSKKEDAK
ncbi:hypothetical protein CH380_02970 [Leptospira adleri]|uniref:Uncharacterized protein n=1 Tax=Leptospira adleri TaxID=2023186 RepID=A0A2M9YT28_9LEPT|nr:hypothetical protein CH380_02970 [Leptospira adleri]PJZ61517.1 hypothetical protein CH376_13055 [Leptospira adleri]